VKHCPFRIVHDRPKGFNTVCFLPFCQFLRNGSFIAIFGVSTPNVRAVSAAYASRLTGLLKPTI
jgi:hypothetical protein